MFFLKDKWLILFVGLLLAGLLTLFVYFRLNKPSSGILSPLGNLRIKPSPTPKPLTKYEFENLKKRGGRQSKIKLDKKLSEKPNFISYLFSYYSDSRKITGLANIPLGKGPLPVIIMIRGYVDQEVYKTGVGTKRAGEVYANNGFITLAPDFLGYGGSDMPPNNVWEERFLRLTSVMDLIASLKNLPQADAGKIGIWGHSNGGMIALSVLEITGKKYPASLWAPVSKYFPYDVLYYTDEFEDKGKALRKSLAEFEKDYNTDKYSFTEYLDWIKAPILLHQGTNDPYIPISWANDLVKNLKSLKKEVVYYKYPKTDHNLKPNWQKAVARDLEFFKKEL